MVKDIQRELYKKYLANFNSYLAKRMEFLADFISGVPQLQTTKFFVNDIIIPFDENRILLNRISGLNNQDYKFNINVILPDKKDDIKVAISNDVLGQQAIYIILENIIRNTAKHSPNNKMKEITFTIKIAEPTNAKSYYKVIIYDNVDRQREGKTFITNNETKYRSENEKKYILSTNGKTITELQRLVIDINNTIDSDIVNDDDFELRPKGLGMIEMKVCSAYLRRIPVQELQDKKYRLCFNANINQCEYKNIPKIFRAVVVDNKYLGYQFYLPKPKEVLFIDTKGDCNDFYNDEWKNNGLICIKEKEIKDTYTHNICVVNADSLDNYNNNLNLPSRKVLWKDVIDCYERKNSNKKLEISINNVQTIFEAIWRTYVSNFYKKKELEDNDSYLCIDYNNDKYSHSFSDHGKDYKFYEETIYNSYIEIKDSKLKFIIDKIKSDNILYFKFLSAMITNVLVLDERIQAESETKYSIQGNTTPPTYQKLWDIINIYIPKKEELDLNADNYSYSDYLDKISEITKEQFINHNNRRSKDIDFIVIHLGVIEKIIISNPVTSSREKSKENILIIINRIKNSFNDVQVIVTSGRGQPTNLPKNIPFVSYTMLSQYLIHKRFKLFLSELLYSAKPLKK